MCASASGFPGLCYFEKTVTAESLNHFWCPQLRLHVFTIRVSMHRISLIKATSMNVFYLAKHAKKSITCWHVEHTHFLLFSHLLLSMHNIDRWMSHTPLNHSLSSKKICIARKRTSLSDRLKRRFYSILLKFAECSFHPHFTYNARLFNYLWWVRLSLSFLFGGE